MASTRRRKSLGLIEQLKLEPYRFDFFQAVRLLERSVIFETDEFFSGQVAGATPPTGEMIRFSAQTSLAFTAADVLKVQFRSHIEASEDDCLKKQYFMEVGFGGLTGSQGVMPYFLTELVQKELKGRSSALKDFLDIFNHRHLSLFYQAWHKYQMPANYERASLTKSRDPDLFTQALASIAGLGTSEARYRMPLPDEALYGMAGHLGRQQCSAAALASMIRQYFGLDVSIEQFHGQWDELPEDVRTRLPDGQLRQGVNNALGVNTLLGSRCFQAQNKFCVIVQPMEFEDYMTLAPGSEKLEALKAFIQFSAGIEMDFEISVTLSTNQVPAVQLAGDGSHQPMLGWNTHMRSGQWQDDNILIRLSAEKLSPDEALPAA